MVVLVEGREGEDTTCPMLGSDGTQRGGGVLLTNNAAVIAKQEACHANDRSEPVCAQSAELGALHLR